MDLALHSMAMLNQKLPFALLAAICMALTSCNPGKPTAEELSEQLISACKAGDATGVSKALDKGADPNEMVEGDTPLSISIGDEDVMRILLKRGAGVNARNGKRLPPLAIAAGAGSIASAKLLIASGANVNDNFEGSHPLDYAVISDSEQMVQLLLDHGAEINPRNHGPSTPLMVAITGPGYHRAEMVRYLLSHGADPMQKTARGLSLVDFAKKIPFSDENDRQEVIRLLSTAKALRTT